jgi:CheY-like chemotaxis protein/HPt (histidine-containing phosphotransfer) domain-containing protein
MVCFDRPEEFWVTLPQFARPNLGHPPFSSSKDGLTIMPLQNTSRVLIADDDPLIRHWLTAILTHDGYEVISKRDGREAFRLLQTDAKFKGAVLDMTMPHLDGPDLIRHMRTEKRLMRIPVMMITAESNIKALAEATSAGATFVLPKPFTKTRLRQTLRLMLGPAASSQGSLSTDIEQADAAHPRSLFDQSFAKEIASQSARQKSAEQPPAVDLRVLRDLVGDDEEGAILIAELIDIYLDSAKRELRLIEESARVSNWTYVKAGCHSLRGASATIGAIPIAKLCEQLEAFGQSNTADELEGILAALKNEYANIRMVLTERREALQLLAA